MSKLREEFHIKLQGVDTTIWIEDGKIAQSGNPEFPKYIAEFSNDAKGRRLARTYILGMVFMDEHTSPSKANNEQKTKAIAELEDKLRSCNDAVNTGLQGIEREYDFLEKNKGSKDHVRLANSWEAMGHSASLVRLFYDQKTEYENELKKLKAV